MPAGAGHTYLDSDGKTANSKEHQSIPMITITVLSGLLRELSGVAGLT
jgi:hypothetical protein